MTAVTYPYRYECRDIEGTGLVPVLTVQLSSLDGGVGIDVDAFLDTGARYSFFDGQYLGGLGLDVLTGVRRGMQTLSRQPIDSFVHTVRIEHDDLGTFDLPIGFSDVPLSRNVLGRDFFEHVQVGFRQHHGAFYVVPAR